jgi:hypothetical protein
MSLCTPNKSKLELNERLKQVQYSMDSLNNMTYTDTTLSQKWYDSNGPVYLKLVEQRRLLLIELDSTPNAKHND